MKKNKKTNQNKILKSTQYKIISVVLLVATLAVSIFGIIYSQKISKEIITKKQQVLNQQNNAQSAQKQQAFFESNQEMIKVVSNTLPNEDTIINVVDDIEKLQAELKIPQAFEFSSIVPTKNTNNSYISFIIKTNTTTLKAIAFLRAFEKLPYLTKITSVNIKTPQGVGGPIELAISGRIYVQNPF